MTTIIMKLRHIPHHFTCLFYLKAGACAVAAKRKRKRQKICQNDYVKIRISIIISFMKPVYDLYGLAQKKWPVFSRIIIFIWNVHLKYTYIYLWNVLAFDMCQNIRSVLLPVEYAFEICIYLRNTHLKNTIYLWNVQVICQRSNCSLYPSSNRFKLTAYVWQFKTRSKSILSVCFDFCFYLCKCRSSNLSFTHILMLSKLLLADSFVLLI